MRMDRRILYFPAVTLTALTFTLTVVLAISTYRNLHREREQMEASLMREGVALLRLFETVVHTDCDNLREEVSHVQQLAAAVAPNDDVAYLYLFDSGGTILAHTTPQRVGQPVDGDIPQGEEILKLRRDDVTGHLFEIRGPFHPISPHTPVPARGESGIDHYLAIGLKMTAVEQIHQSDHKHMMMMAAMLVLLGSASLFFILMVQNFYLVQRTLHRMKSYTHYVVESLANGLISLDATGMVTTVNPAAALLIGRSETEAKRLSFEALFPEHLDGIRNVLYHDTPILNQEMRYQRPDGSRIPVSLSATPVKDNDGNPLGAVILLHDLREVKALQEQAQRAEHLASIGRMAATVAHEIRNPLSSIRGFAQYFATLFPEGKEERTYALAMIEESNRLNRVISELLNYSRPLELNLESVSIHTLFEDTIRIMGVEKQGVEIAQEIEPGLVLVQLDRERMLQVLLNLAQNSLDAMPAGGTLTLKATRLVAQHRIQIVVADTGLGIPASDLPRLFDPFFTTKARGTGLGLAIVRKIMDAHGGTVEVKNVEGGGTQMVLTVPQSGW